MLTFKSRDNKFNMKKFITFVTLTIIFTTQLFAASKNPLKIFKKEILGGEAKKKMALAYDSLTKHKEILHYNKDEEAIEITLDYSMKGHPEDWDLSDEQAQRWEFVTKKKNFYKLGKEVYLKYKFKVNPGLNHDANIWQIVGTQNDGNIIYPAMQIMYTTNKDDLPNRVQFYFQQIEEVFWTDKDPTANRYKKSMYSFDMGSLTRFKKEYQTILFKIKPSKGEDGELIMWVNGERTLEVYGPNLTLDLTGGIAFKIGLYRYWNTEEAKRDPKLIEPTTLSIKEYIISKDCEKVMDKEKCDYKPKERVSRTQYKYKAKDRHYMPEGAKKIKRLKSKTVAKKIEFQDMKPGFLAIIKNKKDEKFLLKHQGYTKDGAAKDGLSKCVENFSNFSDLENNGCYIHYQKKITQF